MYTECKSICLSAVISYRYYLDSIVKTIKYKHFGR